MLGFDVLKNIIIGNLYYYYYYFLNNLLKNLM